MAPKTDPEVLKYILTVFPQELAHLDQVAGILRERNRLSDRLAPMDVEPVLVTVLWMRRVLRHAQLGELDVKGIFQLSACLSHEMPKVEAIREAELRGESQAEFER